MIATPFKNHWYAFPVPACASSVTGNEQFPALAVEVMVAVLVITTGAETVTQVVAVFVTRTEYEAKAVGK